ncbi:discoidin domain-containing protein [Archangium violaceum]|uniref:galactose-binding domain-containing protein n=1 Tax=Archangium violaceum TaxID=83451 RepID=UPI00194FAE9D|nr:discoidin domain-containing protein [Archangium violaceum]QRN99367.1 discoidin domain-containing protein [Archangium violaceum]
MRMPDTRWSTLALKQPLGLIAAGLCLFAPGLASAFCVYNEVGTNANVKVPEGDFSTNLSPGTNGCCNWGEKSCNPSGSREAMLRAQIEAGSFNCVVAMQAGGYALIQQEDRSHLGLPPNYYCVSYNYNHQLVSQSNYGIGAQTRDVRFLITGDPQYQNSGDNTRADQTLASMINTLSGNWQVRGVVVAGDLTQNSRTRDEFSWYKKAISGYSRFVFDGLGNHDMEPPNTTQETACDIAGPAGQHCVDPGAIQADIHDRKRATSLTLQGNPHYSWDWHDVHFVQLNLFPGNEASPGFSKYSPKGSLSFLLLDLATSVGTSGRPVVLIHHYGFDDFSIGVEKPEEVWWTEAERIAYWDVIANYNVVAIFSGHDHRVADQGFQLPFVRPASRTSGPPSIPTFVSGAATSGAFLDVQMDANKMHITRKNQYGNPSGLYAQVQFPVNLALGKPTTQSSTDYNGISSRAVDGSLSGNYSQNSTTHTRESPMDSQPWWEVDLLSVQQLGTVLLHNRTDCCSARLSNFKLMVSNDKVSWQEFQHPGQASRVTGFAVNRSARYVRVQLNGTGILSLAEVQVFQRENLALGRPASQSSLLNSAEAWKAVDGNTDGVFPNLSVTHTLGAPTDPQPWWRVDLQADRWIGSVVLYNRTDCCSTRLSNFKLLVSSDGVTWQEYYHAGAAGPVTTLAVNRYGRHVKIQLAGPDPLSLAEVQVF